MKSKYSAFALVELVVIIVLSVVLFALLMPTLHQREGGCYRSACMSNARQIGLAFKQFAVDNNDEFPGIVTAKNSVTSSSVFASLTNGNYLAIGKVYTCPQDTGKVTGSSSSFGPANNSYACVVSNSTGLHGLNESVSSDNPLIFDTGLKGAPGYVINLKDAKWDSGSSHKGGGGNIFFVGGQAAFRKVFDTGADGTNGFVILP